MATTVTATDTNKDTIHHFQQLFASVEANLNGRTDHPLHQLRRAAINRLEALRFPTRRDEDWKYTSVARVIQPEYREGAAASVAPEVIAAFHYDELDAHRLVFINGVWNAEFSDIGELPAGAVITSVEEAFEEDKYRPAIEEFYRHWTTAEENPFVVLNAAFARNGVFIYVPRNVALEKPVHLIYLSAAGEQPLFINPQSLIVAEDNSEVTVIETFDTLPGNEGVYFNNVVNRYLVKPGAHAHHYKLQNDGAEAFQVNHTEAHQHRDSTYSSYITDLGGRLVRNNLNAILHDQGTHTDYYGAYMAAGEQHIDNQTFIDHAHPHCTSSELYKGIITDRAKGVFNGKVIVRKDAQKTNAFQQNSSLVLSDKAVMDSKPQLEIFADDVKCSHGATIGQLDETSVFYLRTRGLTDQQARTLLQNAFLAEALENFRVEAIAERAQRLINAKLAASKTD